MYNNFLSHFCSVIYKKSFQNMKSGDFSRLSSTFMIKNNGNTKHAHTYRVEQKQKEKNYYL